MTTQGPSKNIDHRKVFSAEYTPWYWHGSKAFRIIISKGLDWRLLGIDGSTRKL